MAADQREWHALTMDALNEINVHVGEEFEIRAVAKSTRPPIKREKPRADERQAELKAEEEALEETQGELL